MMYPTVTVIDNFFKDPDSIVEIANNLEFYPNSDGAWPGRRTKLLHEVEPEFFEFFGQKLHSIFHENIPSYWAISCSFQKVMPFHEDPYNPKNCGWIHNDDSNFGGVIYLTRNPEPDTGTSIYQEKKGFSLQTSEMMNAKRDLYLNKGDITEDEYIKQYTKVNEQYEETICISNVYNRLILFDKGSHHGVRTFGTKERLTLAFFSHHIGTDTYPMCRKY
jgi:hypothetical protein